MPPVSSLILALLLASAPPVPRAAAPLAVAPQSGDSIRTLYENGRPFTDFLEDARSRKDQWHDHYGDGKVSEETLDRARAVTGTWRLLAIAEDWCGDSVNTIPYLARLVEQVPSLDMRVINSKVGRGVMEAHRTPDGRPSTPTVLLLDDDWNVVGCFVERPKPLMDWYQSHREDMTSDDLHKYIFEWYGTDAGATTVSQVVSLMEAATGGHPSCTGAEG